MRAMKHPEWLIALGLVLIAGAAAKWLFAPPHPAGPTPGQQAADSLRRVNSRLTAHMTALLDSMAREGVRLDSARQALRARRFVVGRAEIRADSAVQQARADTSQAKIVMYEAALVLKDSVIVDYRGQVHELDSLLDTASADIRILRGAAQVLLTQNAALVRSNTQLSGEVDVWRRRANRQWYPCGGIGVTANLTPAGQVSSGPGVFAGVCRVVRWPW